MSAVKYHLDAFPPKDINWPALVSLIGRANAGLARYDGLITAIPNASVLLSPLTTQEAVLSSKIEGTNVTMSEVLEIEAGDDRDIITQPKRDDAEEIQNYRDALQFAAASLKDRPVSPHLLRETHALLMSGVRGRDKNPGSFRSEQNWIGPHGCTINNASFVPIPQEHLQAGLDTWAKYVADTEQPDPLVQLAIIHLEFEALHPFKDGNGRLGRMIIPLFLFQRRLLSGPNFYMSGYLEARREDYVLAMREVSERGDWSGWVTFFLEGIINQAEENQEKAKNMLALYQDMMGEVASIRHSHYSSIIVDYIFTRPIFSSSHFVKVSGVPRPSALRFLTLLKNAGILRAIREGSGRRAAIYGFPRLINVAEGRTVL